MISWQCYANVEISIDPVVANYFQYIGEACENKNGVTCIFGPDYLDNFEYVGEL
jgi:hypothetical protein